MLTGTIALILLVITYFAFAFTPFTLALRAFKAIRRSNALLLALLLVVPFLIAASPIMLLQPVIFAVALIKVLAYLLVPTILLTLRLAGAPPFDLFDLLAILSVWLPVEFGWLPGVSAQVFGTSIPIAHLTAICLGFLLFLVVRPVDGVGYTFRLKPVDIGIGLLALAAFAVIGIPLGIAMGFISPGFSTFEPVRWILTWLAIYLLTAIPEELLFRGVIQNLVEQRWGRTWWTLLAAAVFFGLTHLNNTTAHNVPPNWPYAIMAALAGIAYGWTWRKTGKITASAITHSLVNLIWGVVFRS